MRNAKRLTRNPHPQPATRNSGLVEHRGILNMAGGGHWWKWRVLG